MKSKGMRINGEVITFEDTEARNNIQNLDIDKLGVTRYVLQSDLVAQSDALDILSNPTMYEGQMIEFLTNGDLPNKTVALGFVMSEKTGDTYLLTYGLDGTTTQWNRDYHEKHHVETYSFINETVDMDSFTIDVRGDAPYYASVQNAYNKPEKSGNFGMVLILAYSIDKQIQIYRDIETGTCWTRTVTGLADHHSFGTWKMAGGGGFVAQIAEPDNKDILWIDTDDNSTDQPLTVRPLTTVPTQLENNIIFNGAESGIDSVTILAPKQLTRDFYCELSFTSGATPTSFTAPENIKWIGDDTNSRALIPVINSRYNILFYSDGQFMRAVSQRVGI